MGLRVTSEALTESKTFRDEGVREARSKQTEELVLKRVKALMFAVWKDIGWMTTEQVAEFYEVSDKTVRASFGRHREEFLSDGAVILSGKELRDASYILQLASRASQVTIYTPAAVLRMGMILRDSEVARAVRDTIIESLQEQDPIVRGKAVLQRITESYEILKPFISGGSIKLSSYVPSSMTRNALTRKYSNGGIDGFGVDAIRGAIAELSTYTTLKLESEKEIRYRVNSNTHGKYPHLTSEVFAVGGEQIAFVFQFFDPAVYRVDLEDAIGRNYQNLTKAFLEVDEVFLFLVSPFGIATDAIDYLKSYSSGQQKSTIGSLTVKELASLLYGKVSDERVCQGNPKGKIKSKFDRILNYEYPPQSEQLDIFSLLPGAN